MRARPQDARPRPRHLNSEEFAFMNAPEPHDSLFSDACEQKRQEPTPPCLRGSLLGINYGMPARLMASGNAREAALALRKETPFGGILAALGDPGAQASCPKGSDHPFIARMLKHLSEHYGDILFQPLSMPFSGTRAVVIGSGPAGLQAAWTLREQGCAVVVLEAASSAGVTLLHAPVQESSSAPAAPSPAVPADIVERTLTMLSRSGIEFRCASPVGQAELSKLRNSFDLVFCTCGKGAVLPADAEGRVEGNLFAAGTCVKNQKGLGALQSMAAARKAALAAGSAIGENAAPSGWPQGAAKPFVEKALSPENASAQELRPWEEAEYSLRREAQQCLSCLQTV